MGRTVLLLLMLLTIISGGIIISINNEQIRLAESLSDSNDENLAKFISNTYAHNTIKDIRGKFLFSKTDINLKYFPESYTNSKNILNIENSKVVVYIYKNELPKYGKLITNKEWGIMSIGIVNSSVCTTRAVYKKMPFSEFGLYSNSFPNNTYFGDGEVIDGPVYINGNLGIGTAYKLYKYDTKNNDKHWNTYNSGRHLG